MVQGCWALTAKKHACMIMSSQKLDFWGRLFRNSIDICGPPAFIDYLCCARCRRLVRLVIRFSKYKSRWQPETVQGLKSMWDIWILKNLGQHGFCTCWSGLSSCHDKINHFAIKKPKILALVLFALRLCVLSECTHTHTHQGIPNNKLIKGRSTIIWGHVYNSWYWDIE